MRHVFRALLVCPLIACISMCALPGVALCNSPAADLADDIVAGMEQEVERIRIGARGFIVFSNQVRDVIEGESSGRIYLERQGGENRLLVERPGVIVESARQLDFDGDGIKEIGVIWRGFGHLREGRLEIFEVELDGSLTSHDVADRAFGSLPHLTLSDGTGRGGTKYTFALRYALCSVNTLTPMVHETVYFRGANGRIERAGQTIDDWSEPFQALNVAAEMYSSGKTAEGLRIARSTLERIRLEARGDLLADAYLLVARGYRAEGRPGLARAFERRAGLKDALALEKSR